MRGPGPLLTGLLAATALAAVSGQFCRQPPVWTANGDQPMQHTRGKVTVVALLLATWPMCKNQAAGLEAMRQQYVNQGRTDISFMIVNAKEAADHIGELTSRVDTEHFPVYQDTNETNIWRKLRGGKDDIYVYDRCGQLIYYIPFPSSLLQYHLTDWAINAALQYRSPCSCHHDQLSQRRNRRRRHNHERHHNHHSVIVGMGRSSRRDLSRSLEWNGRSCNRPKNHKIIRKLWSVIKKYYRNHLNKRAWICPTVSSELENICSCRQAYFPETLGVCSCEELTINVVQECICFNWESFLTMQSMLSDVVRPNCEYLTSWPCDFSPLESTSDCRWPSNSTSSCHWQIGTNGSEIWSCQGTNNSWSWQAEDDVVKWSCSDNQICRWTQTNWNCNSEIVSSPCRWQQNNDGSHTWQWQHLSGNCMWQCSAVDLGLSWEWPIGETTTAVIRCRSTQTDERWRWQTSSPRVKPCRCTSSHGHTALCRCGSRWKCHSEDSLLHCHWSQSSNQAEVCSWPITTRSLRLWQCETISNNCRWQGLTSSGETWEENNPDGQLWPWQTTWQCQIDAWRWRSGSDGQSLCLWHQASQSWRWQNMFL